MTIKKLLNRTIVGFDLRRNISLHELFMTSYDDSVRYEDFNEKFQEYLSGLNIFFIDPSTIRTISIPIDARVIAFDLPTDYVRYLSNRNVSNPQPLPIFDINSEWKFMGFDVVDPLTQLSAFHGFDLSISLKEKIADFAIDFNDRGLIDDIELAKKLASFFSVEIPEHAAFVHCGIWLKTHNLTQ